MGMQETDGMAGVYNRYQQSVFEDNDFQPEPSAQIGKEYILSLIHILQPTAGSLPEDNAVLRSLTIQPLQIKPAMKGVPFS